MHCKGREEKKEPRMLNVVDSGLVLLVIASCSMYEYSVLCTMVSYSWLVLQFRGQRIMYDIPVTTHVMLALLPAWRGQLSRQTQH